MYPTIIMRTIPRTVAQGLTPSLERGHAPFKHCSGGVADSAVTISLGFEIKQRRSMVGAVECIRDRLIDRNRHGLGRRIDFVAAVNGNRLLAHVVISPRSGTVQT